MVLGRENEHEFLLKYLSLSSLPGCIYLCGPPQSGKSLLLSSVLSECRDHLVTASVSAHPGAIHARLIFEEILCKLHGLSRNSTASKGFSSPVSCDHFSDLVGHLRSGAPALLSGSSKSGIVIVIKNAEKLRDLDANLLPGFMRLQELTGVNLCVLLQSRIGLSKFAPPSGLPFPISVVLRQYNRDQIASIIAEKLRESDRERGNTVYPDKFYHNYISLVLGYFLNACNSLPQLLYVSLLHLSEYKAPIENADDPDSAVVGVDNVRALARHVTKSLEHSLSTLNLRETNSQQLMLATSKISDPNVITASSKRLHVELPFHSKFLLIAAYLASYNPMKSDKRFFMKHHGRQRKTKALIRAKEKRSSQLTGPKAFPLDRMMAIFYSIVDDHVSPSANILSQISSLVSLQFLAAIGSDDSLDMPKYKCIVGLDFIAQIGKQVEFEIHRYLYDFA